MTIFLFAAIIFLSLIQWVVFIDAILSLVSLLGIHFRPVWIQQITVPLYQAIRRIVPTQTRGLDFAPMLVFILIELMTNMILRIDPSILGVLTR